MILFEEEEREMLKCDCENLAKSTGSETLFHYKMLILIENFKKNYVHEHCKMTKDELLNKFEILDDLIKYIK